MNIDNKELKKLIDLVQKSDIAEFEYSEGDIKVRIVRACGSQTYQLPAHPTAYLTGPNQVSNPIPVINGDAAGNEPTAESSAPQVEAGTIIASPMVGTFYRAQAPDAPPYVEVGGNIELDQTLCIIEAMKLMNEIKAEYRCKLLEVLVENGQAVEFGQPLFRVQKI